MYTVYTRLCIHCIHSYVNTIYTPMYTLYTRLCIHCIHSYVYTVYTPMYTLYTLLCIHCIHAYVYTVYTPMYTLYALLCIHCIHAYVYTVCSGPAPFRHIQPRHAVYRRDRLFSVRQWAVVQRGSKQPQRSLYGGLFLLWQ